MGSIIRLIASVLLFAVCTVNVAWCQVDSAMKAIRSLPQDTFRFKELEKWVDITIDTPDELLFLDTLLAEATRYKNVTYQAIAHRNKVRHYHNANKLKKAEEVAGPALAFFKSNKLYSRLFEVEGMIIGLYINRREYEFSLQKAHEMYQEAEALNSRDGKVTACYVISHACHVSGRFREAIDWSRKGIDLISNQKDLTQLDLQSLMELYYVMAESSLSLADMELFKYCLDSVEQQLLAYKREVAGKRELDYSFYWLWLYSRYAAYSLSKNDLEQTRIHLKDASLYLNSRSYGLYHDIFHFACSDYYLAVGDYDLAMIELEKGAVCYRRLTSEEEPEFFRKKAKIYYEMGYYPLAASDLKTYVHISDSLNSIRFVNQSEQLRTIYDMNRLEAESKERTFIIQVQIVMAIFLCATIFILFFFLYRFHKMKRHFVSAAKNALMADQNTSLFLNNMGREVKRFLEEMSALSDKLIDTADQEKCQEYATAIRVRNERAQKVIFDILDFSKIESGRMQFYYETIDLHEFASMVLFHLRELLPQNVKISLEPSDTIIFATDVSRLNQILTSLLSYAMRNTKSGTIYLSYEEREQEVLLKISGKEWTMPDVEHNSLFDRIFHSSSRLEKMDLGMIISRGLIHSLGGSLTVYPGSLGGTRFEFTLPKRSLPKKDMYETI